MIISLKTKVIHLSMICLRVHDTTSSTDCDIDIPSAGVELVSDSENCIITLCENTLEGNYTLAKSIVPEDSIILSKLFCQPPVNLYP